MIHYLLSSFVRIGALSTALIPNQQQHVVNHIPIQPLEKDKISIQVDMYNTELKNIKKEFSYQAQIQLNNAAPQVMLNGYEAQGYFNFATDIEPKIKRNLAVYLAENSRGSKKFSFTKLNENGIRTTTICNIKDCLDTIPNTYKGIYTETRYY